MQLRDYQLKALDEMREALADGLRRLLLVQPTGSGKGEIIAEIIRSATIKGRKSMFLVNRVELTRDMSRRLEKRGVPHGVIQGSATRKPWMPVQVASIDSLRRRTHVPEADILIADEAHFSVSDGWSKVFAKYPNAAIIGSTATPVRLSGEGLGRVFEKIIMGPTVSELQARGCLVPARVFAPSQIDLTGVKKSGGDYNQKDLAKACDKPKLIGDAVEHWLRLSRGRPTVAFCIDIQHSQHTRDKFRAAGVRAEHVDASTTPEDRDKMWAALKSGAVEVVTSVGIISFGWDLPAVSTLILLRPTQSLALHLQQCGRGLRPAPGKEYCLILDHASNHLEHSFVDDEREWTLEDGYVGKKKVAEEDEPAVRLCKQCWCCFPSTVEKCPACGWVYVGKKREIKTAAGELKELVPARWYKCHACQHKGRLPEGATYEDFPCARCQCGPLSKLGSVYDNGADEQGRKAKYIAWYIEGKRREYKPGWPGMRFKQIYGTWPSPKWKDEAESRWSLEEFAGPVAGAEDLFASEGE